MIQQLKVALENAMGGTSFDAQPVDAVDKRERVAFATTEQSPPAMLRRIELAYRSAAPEVRSALTLDQFVAEARAEAVYRSVYCAARPERALGRCPTCGATRR